MFSIQKFQSFLPKSLTILPTQHEDLYQFTVGNRQFHLDLIEHFGFLRLAFFEPLTMTLDEHSTKIMLQGAIEYAKQAKLQGVHLRTNNLHLMTQAEENHFTIHKQSANFFLEFQEGAWDQVISRYNELANQFVTLEDKYLFFHTDYIGNSHHYYHRRLYYEGFHGILILNVEKDDQVRICVYKFEPNTLMEAPLLFSFTLHAIEDVARSFELKVLPKLLKKARLPTLFHPPRYFFELYLKPIWGVLISFDIEPLYEHVQKYVRMFSIEEMCAKLVKSNQLVSVSIQNSYLEADLSALGCQPYRLKYFAQ